MRILGTVVFVLSLILFSSNSTDAGFRKAPEWVISEWINGQGVELDDLKGKVIIVEFFQLWCPGCNKFSIPLMKKWTKVFEDQLNSGKLKMVSIHTVFEGHSFQSPKRLKSFVKEKGIHHLVGIDVHKKGEDIPETMKRYGTRGTPEMAIIDKNGFIRFQRFGGFHVASAERLIRQLIEQPQPKSLP